MNTRKLAIVSTIASLAVWASLTGSAQALMVAGWDFSQWFGAGALSIDGSNGSNTLAANYSNLDPTNNAGAESAAFGTLFFNGQFGSTNVAVDLSGSEEFIPTTDSLASNLNAPVVGGGLNPFDSHSELQSEGQQFANLLSMTAQDVVNVVFEASLTSVPETAGDWSITFGGKTFSGTSSVGVAFSTDGTNYTSFGSVNLDTNDTPFNVALGTALTDTAFVRLSFNPAAGQPIIDNVALNAATVIPEPSTAILLLAGLAGLGAARRHLRA